MALVTNTDFFTDWMIFWTTASSRANRCERFCRKLKCNTQSKAPHFGGELFLIHSATLAAEYDLSAAKFAQTVREWENEFALSVGQVTGSYAGQTTLMARKYSDSLLAESGQALLAAGVMPNSEILKDCVSQTLE